MCQAEQVLDAVIARRDQEHTLEVGESLLAMTQPPVCLGPLEQERNGVGLGFDSGVEIGDVLAAVSVSPCDRSGRHCEQQGTSQRRPESARPWLKLFVAEHSPPFNVRTTLIGRASIAKSVTEVKRIGDPPCGGDQGRWTTLQVSLKFIGPCSWLLLEGGNHDAGRCCRCR